MAWRRPTPATAYVAVIAISDGGYLGHFPDLLDCAPTYGRTEAEVLLALPATLNRELGQMTAFGLPAPPPRRLCDLRGEDRSLLLLVHPSRDRQP